MNREILFRGKRSDNGEWVEGSLVSDSDEFGEILKCFGCESTDDTPDGYYYAQYEVDMSTVGQYTGLTDKNGVKIFDGDIVTVENPNISDDEYGIVKFDNDGAMFIVEFDTFTVDFGNNIDGNRCEIIGNIFDNLELLKGEEND